MNVPASLMPILEDLPEECWEESAQAITRYLELVIEIHDDYEARQAGKPLTDENEPPTLSYSV